MAVQEQANVKVTLNNEEAKREVDELNSRIEKLIQLKKKAETEGDVKGFKKISTELTKAQREAKKYQQQMFNVDKALKNINGASLNELTSAQRALTSQTSKLNRTTDEYTRKTAQLRLVKNEITKIKTEMGQLQTPMQKAIGWAKRLMPAFGFAAIVMGIRKIVNTADETFIKFEERVDNLSSLTGLEGEQLDWLTKKAKETSTATIEGNIRIKQSADSIVDAYTKVGSKRPELLAVKEDLASVTQEAIILSEAAKSDLEPAVAGLTMAMNQFNMPANQARRIINILAAGSKAGAGDIPYLTAAMEKSGTTANLMRIPMEQWAGAVESVAPYYEQASMAGNSFDKVLLKLKEKQIGYVNGVFDLNTALDQLEKMYASGTSSSEIFGDEHSKMGELLVKERGNLDKYTAAVTGSNVAIEQAAKNTNNEAAKRAQAQNKLNILYLEFGEKIAPMLTRGISSGVELLNVAIKYRGVLLAITAATGTYIAVTKLKVFWDTAQKGAIIAAAGAQALFTGNLTRATAAMRLFNTVTKLNPFVLIASLVAAAGIALFAYSNRVKESTDVSKKHFDLLKEEKELLKGYSSEIVTEKNNLNSLVGSILSVNNNETERKILIQQLKKEFPEFLKGIDSETISNEQLRAKLDQVNMLYSEKIRLSALQAKIQAINNASIKAEERKLEIEDRIIEIEKERYRIGDKKADEEIKSLTTEYNSLNFALSAYEKKRKTLYDQSVILNRQISEYDTVEYYTNQLKGLEKATILYQSNLEKARESGSQEEIDHYQKQIDLTSQQIELFKNRKKELEELAKLSSNGSSGGNGGSNKSLSDLQNEASKIKTEEDAPIDTGWIFAQVDKDAEAFAAKKRTEEEWTKFLEDQIEQRIQAQKYEADIEKEIEQAREDLKDMRIDAIGQIAGALSGMFESGSSAQIAALAIEKAIAIAQVWISYAKESAAIHAASAVMGPVGIAWDAAMQTKAITNAGINTGIIAAQAIAQAVSSKKSKDNTTQYASGKYPAIGANDGRMYDTNFAGRPKTGIYSGPQLGIFNEDPQRPEMVVDGKTTRQLILNYPAIYKGIRQMAAGVTPQFANGKYPTTSNLPQPYTPSGLSSADIKLFATAVREFRKHKTQVEYVKIRKGLAELEEMDNQSRLD